MKYFKRIFGFDLILGKIIPDQNSDRKDVDGDLSNAIQFLQTGAESESILLYYTRVMRTL